MERLEAVGNIVRTCRDENGMGGFFVAEVSVVRPDCHKLAVLIEQAPNLLDVLCAYPAGDGDVQIERWYKMARSVITQATRVD